MMVSYIELQNFKSFSHVLFDLRGTHGIPKKMAFLYGENGSGKSNLIRSLTFIGQSFDTFKNRQELSDIDISPFDVLKDEELKEKFLSEIIRKRFYSLQDLVRQNRSIDEDSPMVVKVGFYHQGHEGFYMARFSTQANFESIIEEKLYYTINKRSGLVFDLSESNVNLSPSSFPDVKYRLELAELIEKYWGKNTFISILHNELHTKNKQYFESRLAPALREVLRLMRRISTLYKDSDSEI